LKGKIQVLKTDILTLPEWFKSELKKAIAVKIEQEREVKEKE
jgi:hypothetical protein